MGERSHRDRSHNTRTDSGHGGNGRQGHKGQRTDSHQRTGKPNGSNNNTHPKNHDQNHNSNSNSNRNNSNNNNHNQNQTQNTYNHNYNRNNSNSNNGSNMNTPKYNDSRNANAKKWNMSPRQTLAEFITEFMMTGTINPRVLRDLVVVTAMLLDGYCNKRVADGLSERQIVQELYMPAKACFMLDRLMQRLLEGSLAAFRPDEEGDVPMLDVDDQIYNSSAPQASCFNNINLMDLDVYLGQIICDQIRGASSL